MFMPCLFAYTTESISTGTTAQQYDTGEIATVPTVQILGKLHICTSNKRQVVPVSHPFQHKPKPAFKSSYKISFKENHKS
jgi:hypothetical protein